MTRWYVRLLGPGIDVSGYVEAEEHYQVERLFADDVTEAAALIVSNINPGERRIYRVVHREVDGVCVDECPLCGPLSGAVLRGHGPEHIIEDASQ